MSFVTLLQRKKSLNLLKSLKKPSLIGQSLKLSTSTAFLLTKDKSKGGYAHSYPVLLSSGTAGWNLNLNSFLSIPLKISNLIKRILKYNAFADSGRYGDSPGHQ